MAVWSPRRWCIGGVAAAFVQGVVRGVGEGGSVNEAAPAGPRKEWVVRAAPETLYTSSYGHVFLETMFRCGLCAFAVAGSRHREHKSGFDGVF